MASQKSQVSVKYVMPSIVSWRWKSPCCRFVVLKRVDGHLHFSTIRFASYAQSIPSVWRFKTYYTRFGANDSPFSWLFWCILWWPGMQGFDTSPNQHFLKLYLRGRSTVSWKNWQIKLPKSWNGAAAQSEGLLTVGLRLRAEDGRCCSFNVRLFKLWMVFCRWCYVNWGSDGDDCFSVVWGW